jgi:GMP synthase-like glutamine amidotransferase
VGLAEIRLTPAAAADPFFARVSAAMGPVFTAVQWHQDAIADLPPGAVPLATGTRYPHQGFRIGDAAWAVQYHPEVSAEDWADWMVSYHGALHPEGLDLAAVNDPVLAAEPRLAALADAHVAAFAAVLRERADRATSR